MGVRVTPKEEWDWMRYLKEDLEGFGIKLERWRES